MDPIKNIVRRAEFKDVSDIALMWIKLSADQLQKDKFYTGEIPDSVNESIEHYTELLENENCGIFILENENSVYGYIEVWRSAKDFHFFIDDHAYILHYYIEESFRNSPQSLYYFHQLYNCVEKWASEKKLLYIVADVFEHNNKVAKLLGHLCKMELYRHKLVKKLDEGANY
ncbi:hypothetical protein [Paenibacillus tianjinensis]|uniref:N-acetyltransferase domain-containing protein n=1 Tax=Paenibacillus tianjinensis TaxID=2810347 RepID=A0ABX7LA32_9BACL|nr:hypothetical protein [Paenibacillus tianjinensis]QSF44231.1 hypothetical protein JRJ22_23920 [Paenibacillus tianjinensis]